MRQDTATVTVRGVPLEVDFCYYPFRRGHRDSLGVPEEPDEPKEVEVEEVTLAGHEIMQFFSDEAIAEVGDAILKMER